MSAAPSTPQHPLRRRLFSIPAWRSRFNRRVLPWCRPSWTKGAPKKGSAPCVAVITVNYNTKNLLARLIFSLRRVVDGVARLGPIIVVDNNSTDGSRELIRHLSDQHVVFGILNDQQRYHGPGLNQAMAFLLDRRRSGDPRFTQIDYVYVVDSDVIVTKGEIFDAALTALKSSGSCMAGELEVAQNAYIEGGYLHVSSLLIDPLATWRKGFIPFEEHGVPALAFQQSVIRNGLTRLWFPFYSRFYAIHLWSGTMKAICTANEQDNKYFAWAKANLPVQSSIDAGSTSILQEFETVFQEAIPALDPELITNACLSASRIRLKKAYELEPSIRDWNIVAKPGRGLMMSAEGTTGGPENSRAQSEANSAPHPKAKGRR